MDSIKEFIHFIVMFLTIFIIVILQSLSYDSAALNFSVPTVVWLLASDGGKLLCLFMFVCVFCKHLEFYYVWGDS